MPKRTDIQSILIIGAGPIVIGQACEFDYSGVQACKVLRREGYRIILVNSNPATIMTDPQFADATYIEPLTPEVVEKIIQKEKPDAILPTVGGQTALNLAMKLDELGILERYGVKLIGASPDAIDLAEDRQRFKNAMIENNLKVPEGDTIHTVEEAVVLAAKIGYPVLIRPSFTLGGSGGGVAYDEAELREIAERGLRASPVHQVLIEQSVLGWKARPQEQLCGSVFDREHRPNGCSHWRLDHRSTSHDLDRPRASALARYGQEGYGSCWC
jgi:carbamoyl-phosphate synthase large subunit